MNWTWFRSIRVEQVGLLLALLIVAFMPNYGIKKFGPSPLVPSFLLMGIGLWFAWRERSALFQGRAIRRLTTVFLLLLVPVLISLPTSYSPRLTLQVAGVLVLFFWVGVALIRILRGDAARHWLSKWITVILVLWIVDGLIQYVFGRDLIGVPIALQNRVTGMFYHNLRLPVLLALLLPIGIAFLVVRFRVWSGVLLLLAGSITAALSGARSILPWLGMIAVATVGWLPRNRWKLPLMFAGFALVGVVISLTPATQERFARLVQMESVNFATLNFFTGYRLNIWSTAVAMAEGRPLTGVGAGAFAAAYRDFATSPDDIFATGIKKVHHAHQAYLALLAECGLPGVLGLFIILMLGLRWYLQASPERRSLAWPFGLGLGVYLFPFNLQQPLYNVFNSIFPVLVLLLAATLAALEPAPKDVPAV
jgi:O-antigen ligase